MAVNTNSRKRLDEAWKLMDVMESSDLLSLQQEGRVLMPNQSLEPEMPLDINAISK
eukprot:CAMPEP_0116871588 /NCGR_PEP_ID=MMETSP0463-20121206/2022_1 /TAXON_ID=181622 /ORGANISM="Strombidinopsis sp, Strain SopsisLIS2011" /LENGTH=55 /DNA_ID=CAMNT_0004510327 /DNA_START=230 /DNA_END=397 /DNA_ORIENTATION=+